MVGYVWECPYLSRYRGVTGAIVGGWQVSGIVTYASGFPFDITQSGDSQNNDGLWQRPDLVPGTSVSAANQTPDLWFNTGAFQRSVLHYGNSPRNPVTGPGTKTWDLSASKSFRMPGPEGSRLMFRSEFFNAFNTPQFGNPGSSLGTGTFGVITSTALPSRQIQFALKYLF